MEEGPKEGERRLGKGGSKGRGKGMCERVLVFASAEGEVGTREGLMDERKCSSRLKRE